MKHPVSVWVDDALNFGVVEIKDEIFGSSFHPVQFNPEDKKEFFIINNLWYTTYHGARQFFRSKTNNCSVTGRMKKVEGHTFTEKVLDVKVI